MFSLSFLKKYTNLVEEAPYPLWYFVATFFSVVTLRIFTEFFSNSVPVMPPAAYLWGFLTGTFGFYSIQSMVHLYFFYIALDLCFILLLYAFTRQKITRLFKLAVTSCGIILVVPVADFILSAGHGFRLDYLYPDTFSAAARLFFTFFGPLQNAGMPPGITPGIRIEVLLVVTAVFVYLWNVHGQSLVRSIAGAVGTYAVIFLFFISPSILQILSHLSGAVAVLHSEAALGNLYILLGVVVGVVLLALTDWPSIRTIVRDIRLPKLIHYYLVLVVGIWLATKTSFIPMTDETMFYFPFLFGAVAFAWVFSVITNNLSDVAIDAVSNPERPLVAGHITPETYKRVAWVTLGLSLGLALAVNYRALFFVAVFIGNYFIYSMPPLRLKRIPLFSKLTVLFNSLALIMLGFTTFNAGDLNSLLHMLYTNWISLVSLLGVSAVSAKILLTVLFFVLLLAAEFTNLKDYEGDKRGGIKTLPVLLGLRRSKFLIGGAFLFLYTVAGALLGGPAMFVAVGLGLLQFYFINREEYREKYVFAIYLPSLFALFFIL